MQTAAVIFGAVSRDLVLIQNLRLSAFWHFYLILFEKVIISLLKLDMTHFGCVLNEPKHLKKKIYDSSINFHKRSSEHGKKMSVTLL